METKAQILSAKARIAAMNAKKAQDRATELAWRAAGKPATREWDDGTVERVIEDAE